MPPMPMPSMSGAVPAPETPIFEARTLAALTGQFDAATAASLIDGFLTDLDQRRKALDSALAAGDAKAVAEQAHAMKAAAETYGTPRLAKESAVIDAILKGEISGAARAAPAESEEILARAPALIATLDRTHAEISAWAARSAE